MPLLRPDSGGQRCVRYPSLPLRHTGNLHCGCCPQRRRPMLPHRFPRGYDHLCTFSSRSCLPTRTKSLVPTSSVNSFFSGPKSGHSSDLHAAVAGFLPQACLAEASRNRRATTKCAPRSPTYLRRRGRCDDPGGMTARRRADSEATGRR